MAPKMTKAASLSLAAVLASMSLLSACSSNSNADAGNAASGGGSASAGTASSPAASGKQVTLKVELFDRGNTPSPYTITDSYLTKYIQDNFGTPNNIKMEFVPVPRSEEIKKLNVLMASGSDVPDIVFTYDSATFNRYAQQGGLADLSDLLNQYGSNLKTFLGDDALAYGVYDGKQLAIPGKRSILGKYSSFIRTDWLDALGMKAPTTTQELYDTLVAFKEKDPGKTGGKVIPYGMTIEPAQYDPLIWSFIQPMTDEQRFTLTQKLGSNEYPTLLPGFKDALQFYNKLYNEGLISKDFGLDKDKKQMTQDVQNGLVGFLTEDYPNLYYADGTYENLLKTVPTAKLDPIDAFTNSEGKHAKPAYAPNGMYIMIPKSSKNAAEAVKYLDWMAQTDNMLALQNGVEGENYEMKDGIPIVKTDAPQNVIDRIYNYGDIVILANGKFTGDEEKNKQAFAAGFPPAYQENLRKALDISVTDTFAPLLIDRPIEAESKYGTALQDKYEEFIVKAATAKPANFESAYESALKDYMQSGGQAILDERTKLYQEKK
ncbi:extracellular solute-binding protein [Cohnella sp. GCM10020058]|uniref:extracellular solute-binding protein n=1 Tax=Cohnella sp. GCM10020058 TaxID=3317330 RepID=UPI003627AEFA